MSECINHPILGMLWFPSFRTFWYSTYQTLNRCSWHLVKQPWVLLSYMLGPHVLGHWCQPSDSQRRTSPSTGHPIPFEKGRSSIWKAHRPTKQLRKTDVPDSRIGLCSVVRCKLVQVLRVQVVVLEVAAFRIYQKVPVHESCLYELLIENLPTPRNLYKAT